MAEEQDSQEKTEEPTQRKIDKSLEDGQFLTSKEMFVFSSVFIGLLTLVFISSLFPNFMATWKSFFIFSLEELDYQKPYLGILKLIKIIVILTLLIGFPLLISSIITQFCVGGGIHFSPNRGNGCKLGLVTSKKYYDKYMEFKSKHPLLFSFQIFKKLTYELENNFKIVE